MGTGMTVAVPLRVQNLSNFDFDSSINLSYHWYDASGASVVWDGVRTSLAGLRQGEVRAVSVPVAVPATVGGSTLRYAVGREGVAWVSSKGMQLPSRSVAVQLPPYGATYAVQSAVTGQAGTSVTVPVTLTNNGSDRKSTRLNSSHDQISYAVFCLKKKNTSRIPTLTSIHFPSVHTRRRSC